MKRFIATSVAILALGVGTAYADSINFGNPTVTPSGTDFLWAYPVNIDQFEHINTAQNASFITLYDISGLVSGSQSYSGGPASLTETLSVQNVGSTPGNQNPTDNPNIPNVTVNYSGSAPTSSSLGTLSFLDTFSGTNVAFGNFSAQATNNTGNVLEANTSSVPVPTPEPGTIALFASGLGTLLLLRRRK